MSSVSFDDVVEVVSFYLISVVEELDITTVNQSVGAAWGYCRQTCWKTHPLASLASARTVTDASTVLINDDSDMHSIQYKLMGSVGYPQQSWPTKS